MTQLSTILIVQIWPLFCQLRCGECAYLASSHTQSLVLYICSASSYIYICFTPQLAKWPRINKEKALGYNSYPSVGLTRTMPQTDLAEAAEECWSQIDSFCHSLSSQKQPSKFAAPESQMLLSRGMSRVVHLHPPCTWNDQCHTSQIQELRPALALAMQWL